jgi:hypothetical protein
MVSHQNGHSRTMMVILPRCSDIRPNWIKGYQDDGHIYSRADVNEYIPGIATACWVPSDKVQEGDRFGCSSGVRSWVWQKPVPMMQTVGAQCGGSVTEPSYRCVCVHACTRCPSTSDGSQDCMNRLGAKWEYETPTDAMRQFFEHPEVRRGQARRRRVVVLGTRTCRGPCRISWSS